MLKEISKISRVIREFRSRDMNINVMDLFVQIVLRPEGADATALKQRVGLSDAVFHRMQHWLAQGYKDDNTGKRIEGLEWITINADYSDGRKNVLTLTKKGERMAQELADIIKE